MGNTPREDEEVVHGDSISCAEGGGAAMRVCAEPPSLREPCVEDIRPKGRCQIDERSTT